MDKETLSVAADVAALAAVLWSFSKWVRKHWPPGPKRHPTTPGAQGDGDLGRGIAYAVACAVIWSASYVSLGRIFARPPEQDLWPALHGTVLLFGFAAFFLFVAGWLKARHERASGLTELEAPLRPTSPTAIGLTAANLGNFVGGNGALAFISPSSAMAISNTFPLFVAILVILRGQLKPNWGQAAALFTVAWGLWLASGGENGGAPTPGAGVLLALFCALAFACWTDLLTDIESNRTSTRLRSLGVVFMSSYVILSTALYLAAVATRSAVLPRFEMSDVGWLAANGLRVAVVYVLYWAAVRHAGPFLASVLVLLEVPLTPFIESAWIGTAIRPELAMAIGLIVVGAVQLVSLSENNKRGTE